MAINAAEEETIESLKKWWEENGKQLMLGAVTIVAVFSAWSYWQYSQSGASESASDVYEEILALTLTEPGVLVSEADLS